MIRALKNIISGIAGNSAIFSLEHRLFNSLSLLSGISNIAGSVYYIEGLTVPGNITIFTLFALHLFSGLLMLMMYLFSRFGGHYRRFFWPFILIIFVFLFVNVLYNAGSQGGAHYYLIAAVLIGVILSPGKFSTVLCFALGIIVSGFLFWVEYQHPEWIQFFANKEERFADVPGTFIFMQIFNGVLVLILRVHFTEERDKSERLLLNILPVSIAEELKTKERVQPEHYEKASVLFTDFVGFTRIAENMDPQKLLNMLDDCFRSFDQIINKYKIEKIKTIGDAYMAAGGIPKPNSTNPIDVVLAAMEMQDHMEASRDLYTNETGEYWQLRIGAHTGPIVAGVIGEQKFAYDVWGDSVNVASRMESSSTPGKINISSEMYKEVKKFFECSYRGKIEIKNRGGVEMYFVQRLQAPFARDLNGRLTNDNFWKHYHNIEKKAF